MSKRYTPNQPISLGFEMFHAFLLTVSEGKLLTCLITKIPTVFGVFCLELPLRQNQRSIDLVTWKRVIVGSFIVSLSVGRVSVGCED